MYEKQTWKTGDVITEEKLNHIEDGVSTGGGIYSVENVTCFDGEVTTETNPDYDEADGNINFDKLLPEKEIQVTFNGREYTLPYVVGSDLRGWGELSLESQPVFSNYPIFIIYRDSSDMDVMVITEEAGTYSLTIKNKELQLLKIN